MITTTENKKKKKFILGEYIDLHKEKSLEATCRKFSYQVVKIRTQM